MENNQPIIIKRVKRFAGGHHGGAWKIAFADFATAMMAFFLVLWLMSTATPEQKIAIAGYFKDPIGFSESGTPYIIDLGGTPSWRRKTINPEVKSEPQPDKAVDAEQVEAWPSRSSRSVWNCCCKSCRTRSKKPAAAEVQGPDPVRDHPDGLRIQIMDAENRPMFDSGSARLKPYFEDILLAMADTIKAVPNKISISGHTDAKPYTGTGDFGNWELSANRANAARRALVAGSYPDQQVARVVGYASSALFDREHPFNPINRRIDIIVLTKSPTRHRRLARGRTCP
jgi:chemotaxis protein MotB